MARRNSWSTTPIPRPRSSKAAVIQWYWLEETQGGRDQWNSLHERLVACWQRHAPRLPDRRVHFAYTEEEMTGEDLMTVTYLRETANQAGLGTETPVDGADRLGSRREPLRRRGARTDHQHLQALSLGVLLADRFGPRVLQSMAQTRWIEPTWKSILANKALLALLWERYPDHPNLLPPSSPVRAT
jgi:glutathionylspermidine synthase